MGQTRDGKRIKAISEHFAAGGAETHAPGTRINTFFPGTFEKLTLSSRSLILISTSGTASPALIGDAEARAAKAW